MRFLNTNKNILFIYIFSIMKTLSFSKSETINVIYCYFILVRIRINT